MYDMKIKQDSRNYRQHGDKNKGIIKKSLEEFGAGRSILLDNQNQIIAGNGVFEQAEKLNIPVRVIETDGSELIAVKRTDLKTSDEKRKQLALIDNHASDTSEFDMEMVKMDFDEYFLSEFDFDLGIILEPEVSDDNYNIPDEIKTDIKLGDIFNIGNHKLICGSATEIETYEKIFRENTADMVLTDPPYNVNYTGKTKDALKIQNDKMTNDNFYNFLYDFYTAAMTYCKSGGGGIYGTLIQKGIILD